MRYKLPCSLREFLTKIGNPTWMAGEGAYAVNLTRKPVFLDGLPAHDYVRAFITPVAESEIDVRLDRLPGHRPLSATNEELWDTWLRCNLPELAFMPKSTTPNVPKQPKVLQRWKATWREVHAQWEDGKTYEQMASWLSRVSRSLSCSEDTLRRIIAAGEARMLD